MGLSVKVSNSLEILVAAFSEALRTAPGDVFQPEFIITQTEGMNNWLKLRISSLDGIAANLRFVKPNDILFQVYDRLGGPREQVLSSDHLEWILFRELEDAEFKRRFPSVAGYYQEGEEIKRLELARKVADLFDQYQIYRPALIGEWNAGETGRGVAEWQAWLWNRVKKDYGDRMSDKTAMAAFITAALRDPDRVAALARRLPRVYLFGLSILTGFHIDLFHQLSGHIDIGFYLLNPAPSEYWYEDRSAQQIARWKRLPGHERFEVPQVGNTLLANWGKVIRDTFALLFRHDSFFNVYDDARVAEPPRDTLLHKIQSDLFHNAVDNRQPLTARDVRDGSISFNACYTPAREVEVLYDYLVHLVDTGMVSSPREVVVMVGDINTYAPYIRAVFDSAPYRLPYSIADETLGDDRGFFGALQAVMSLEEEDFTAETVLDLLEFRVIRERFDITRQEFIRQAVDEANIRFGIEGSEADESVTVSWVNGLKRIMYGICMKGEGQYAGAGYGFYPLDIQEGEGALELVRFTHFVEVLIEVTASRRRPATLAEWGHYLQDAAEALLVSRTAGEDPDYELFTEYLDELQRVSDTVTGSVSFRVFRESFLGRMASETRQGNFIGGGITFCSLIPMRSIPFNTIAMLGLNFDAFPRKETRVPFDLIKLELEVGDRNVRENDKHLFLETVLSAHERLYISYLGRSPKDSSVLPPSALVEELMEYIREGAGEVVPLTVHPLHAFSSRYGVDAGLYTYRGTAAAARAIPERSGEPAAEPSPDVDVNAFIRFFKNPFQAYYNQRLGIYYRKDPVLLSDTEVFELDRLQQWSLKNDLVFMRKEDLAAYRDREVKLGALPLRHMADLAIAAARDEIARVTELVNACTGGVSPELTAVKVPLNGALLAGEVALYGDKRVTICFSKSESKYCLEAYLLHLVSVAAGLGGETHFISGASFQDVVIPGERWSPSEARERLEHLMAYYREGQRALLPYSPDLRIDMAKLTDMDFEGFSKALVQTFDEKHGVKDPYLRREYADGFFDAPETFERYRGLATDIYGPVYTTFNR
jgi:exodeoxyribonuclease V gamma subunit